MQHVFTKKLLYWHRVHNTRTMPWKGEKDPYKIWLSEIILQQTRVEQGLAYYNRFIKTFPTIFDLAKAKDQQVFKLWEGLGYYTRCKNLLITARVIVKRYNGAFPPDYQELIKLKGIGPYTAAAIASFSFNLPHAVVDGNVFRVLSRYFGIDTPIDTTTGKKQFTILANQLLDHKEASVYNQAIMDFGATLCKPANPACNICPLKKNCTAFTTKKVFQLPVKEKILSKKRRYFNYFLFEYNGSFFIRQRMAKDIWQSLFEFYLYESDKIIHWDKKAVLQWLHMHLALSDNMIIGQISPVLRQHLTHQQIDVQFIHVTLPDIPDMFINGEWKKTNKPGKWAFPVIIAQYLANR